MDHFNLTSEFSLGRWVKLRVIIAYAKAHGNSANGREFTIDVSGPGERERSYPEDNKFWIDNKNHIKVSSSSSE